METVPLSLALFDVPPNFLFLLGAYLLYRRRYPSRVFAVGSALVFFNGLTKAIYKLIIAFGGPDILWLSQVFVPLLASGFLLMFAAVLYDRLAERALAGPGAVTRAVPVAVAGWKIPFMAAAALSAVGVHLLWVEDALRRRRRLAALFFALAGAGVMVMAGLSGGGGRTPEEVLARNWTAESVNNAGQLCFALGAWLHVRRG
jgi:hypothetical protein